MTSDELPPGVPRIGLEDLAPIEEMGQSFGLGFAVRTDAGHSPLPGSVGDYLGAGAFGTYFRVVPKGEVMMVQIPFAESGYYRRAMGEVVYGALVQ